MHYFLAFSGLGTGIAAVIFGCFVYLKNRRDIINTSYAVLSLSIAVWGIAYYFWPLAQSKSEALLSFQALHLGAILIAPSYLWFSASLVGLEKKRKKLIIFSYLAAAAFLILCPTPFFIRDMQPLYIFRYWAVPGPAYHFYLIFWSSCFLYSWFMLIKGYLGTNPPFKKKQLGYVIFGTILGALGGATNYLLWYKIYFPPVGTFLVGVHVIILAYAVVKFRLMDIRIAVTRSGIFLVVYTLVLGFPLGLSAFARQRLILLLGDSWWIVPFALLTILATLGPFLYIYLQRKAELLILRRQRAYQETLKQAARELARIHNVKKLLDLIVHIVTKTVGISHATLYIFDEKTEECFLKAKRNAGRTRLRGSLNKDNPLVKALRNHKEIIVFDELLKKTYGRDKEFFAKLEKELVSLGAGLVVPGFLKERFLGFLVLGPKRSGEFYSPQDIDTLSVIAHQATLAIENARLYENMEDEIRQRTEELMEAQKQLVHAEKLATIGTLAGGVAHEINNPLTAVLTNVQMLLADNSIKDKDSLDSLKLMEEATKRCRDIVQKLMYYAQKPQGKVSRVDLLKAVNNVVAFLGYQLEQENIRVTIETGNGACWVTGNQNELEQVFTNIILNARDAIKKEKKDGQIQIKMLECGRSITVSIKDSGCGIPKEVLPKIFDPFFTTKEVGKGTGLGLSICQSIVEKHGGKISAQSEINNGSEFIIELPKA